jgi:hypothetical protein
MTAIGNCFLISMHSFRGKTLSWRDFFGNYWDDVAVNCDARFEEKGVLIREWVMMGMELVRGCDGD